MNKKALAMISDRLRYLLYTLLILFPIIVSAQPKCYFEHYGSDDGLPQHSIMDIHQDKNGFMWSATWDGLCKFDGYNFKTYRLLDEGGKQIWGNRIERILEDSNGYLWITLPYERKPIRFDPKTETFLGLRHFKQYADLTFSYKEMITTRSGKMWFISDHTGAICIPDPEFNIEIYNKSSKRLRSDRVYTVHEDSNGNSWLLTDNGLYMVSGDKKISNLFVEKASRGGDKLSQSFYSVLEMKSEIWFGSDMGRIWIYNKRNGQFRLLETHSKSNIQYIKNIDGNQILLVTYNDGFYIYQKTSNKLTHYSKSSLPDMQTDVIHSCYIDKDLNVWFELDCIGTARFDTENKTLKHYAAKVETAVSNVFPPNFFILEDKNGRIWVHPRGGGFSLFDKEKDQLIPFYNEPSSSDWRFSNMLHSAFSDKQGNLWLSTRSQGLEKIIFKNNLFSTRIIDENIHTTINNDVRCIYVDSQKRMWVSTKLGKIYVYDRNKKSLGYVCSNGTIGFGESLQGTCYSILEDDRNNIWIGTKGEGVYRLQPLAGNDRYTITQYKSSNKDLYSLTGNSIYSIFQDNKKRIWVGSYGTGGLNLFEDKHGGRFINVKNHLKDYPATGAQIRIISSDKYGNICVGTTLGLIMFSSDFEYPESIKYNIYTRQEDDKSLFSSDIYDICTTRKGETYLATFGGGLSLIKQVDAKGFPLTFETYSTRNGLPSNIILNIIDDRHSNLWIASEGNISKLDSQKKELETYSQASRTLGGATFSEGSRCSADSGIIYFGYSKGLIHLDPDQVSNNTFKPYVALTKFQISNKDIPVGEDSPLTENIDDQKYIKLNHKQNIISLEFVALDYVDPSHIIYAYMLEGFDNDWIITKNQRVVNYTNLAPGKYRFKVKSTNSDGVWMNNEHIIDIEITPSFWQTRWAYLLYIAATILSIYLVMRILFIFYRLQDKIKLEHEQAEMKIRFFTDISHEIRTPLTMIVSPVENILHNSNPTDEVKSQLNLVLKNTNRMIRMVNQILDFRKVQKQKLNLQKTPIGDFVEDICNGFTEISKDKHIDLLVNNDVGDELLWVDRDSFEKLLFNLLSNAFKYTPENRRIEVTVRSAKKDDSIEIQVKDEGTGMTRDVQNKLFVRFASFNKDKSKPSTGIGLSIVKEVADKHHARLMVNSEENKGSSFSVFFERGLDHFSNDSNIVVTHAETSLELNSQHLLDGDSETTTDTTTTESNLSILITEDDTDLRQFIKTMLSPHYNILEAADGKTGYELAAEHLPDFIISDIMMPEIDGLEFLQKVRNSTATSHIPFILLSAKSDIESKLSGLEYGADDYITKPFSVNYLKARIENIIKQRKALIEKLAVNQPIQPIAKKPVQNKQDVTITTQDESFILKVKDEIFRNMDDSSFLIDDLASAMAMSRTVFFKKIKSLTGQAPVDFIRDLRMNQAAKYLEETTYSIKEIAYMVGISDTKYFTQCFKKKFEVTPSEYRNSKKSADTRED